MKYILERSTLLKTDEIRKGDILVLRLLQIIKEDPSVVKYRISGRYHRYQIEIGERIYYFDFVGGWFTNDVFLIIYNKKDVKDLSFPDHYQNPISSRYEFSMKMFKLSNKLIDISTDIKLPELDIPERFLSDSKFMNDLAELSEDSLMANKYNL